MSPATPKWDTLFDMLSLFHRFCDQRKLADSNTEKRHASKVTVVKFTKFMLVKCCITAESYFSPHQNQRSAWTLHHFIVLRNSARVFSTSESVRIMLRYNWKTIFEKPSTLELKGKKKCSSTAVTQQVLHLVMSSSAISSCSISKKTWTYRGLHAKVGMSVCVMKQREATELGASSLPARWSWWATARWGAEGTCAAAALWRTGKPEHEGWAPGADAGSPPDALNKTHKSALVTQKTQRKRSSQDLHLFITSVTRTT